MQRMRREPANGRQLEEKNQDAYQKQLESCTESSLGTSEGLGGRTIVHKPLVSQ